MTSIMSVNHVDRAISTEEQAQSQRRHARVARGGDLTERGRAKRRIHAGKLRVVEQVEELRAELQ